MIRKTIGEWKEYLDLEKAKCPRCGSDDLERADKNTIRCNECKDKGRFWYKILDWVLAQNQYQKEHTTSTKQTDIFELKKMKSINFSEYYGKLYQRCFETIRLDTELEVDEKVWVKVNRKNQFTAWVCDIDHKKIKELPTNFLTKDTDTETRSEAIEELRRFYPDLDEETEVVIIDLMITDTFFVDTGDTDQKSIDQFN